MHWGEKHYYSLDYYLRQTYGEKLYKISLNGGMTCPNRDGSLSDKGCIFCSSGGSGDFAADPGLSVTSQIETGKKQVSSKYHGTGYIAYFQAYTNTYGPVSYLRSIFEEAIAHPDIRILSIATRPDCLGHDVLDLLEELNKKKPVWIELGLQTIHEDTARFIRRCYSLHTFETAVSSLRQRQLSVIPHIILGLPGETPSMNLQTIHYLNSQDIQGIKIHLLHILKGTDLAEYYHDHPFHLPSMEDYIFQICNCLMALRPDIVVHRLTGDGPKSMLIAPLWTGNKRQVLNRMHAYMKEHDIWQGKEYHYDNNF